jgi:hypothetical protein
MKRAVESSRPQTGTEEDDEWQGIRDVMAHAGVPFTRENYLDVVHMGDPPEEIDENEMPPELRLN